MHPDLALALELADAADALALERFRSLDLAVERKPDLSPVTEADRAVEALLRRRIAAARPGHAVVGEEFGTEGHGDSRWIIDPIDGTKNYIRGIPVFGTLIALERDGDQVLGVISAPALGRRWWAVRGGGAFATDLRSDGTGDRRGRPISVSRVARLEDAQLCFGGLRTWRAAGLLDRFLDLTARCWRSRGFGDFWMHMLVAEGAAEMAVEMEVSVWDLAAVKVIVEEAGGRFTDLSGVPTPAGGSALSSNGLVHDRVLEVLGTGSRAAPAPGRG